MVTCPECDEEIDDEELEYECPFCGYEDYGEGFYHCYNCETLFDGYGDLWVCENCDNDGITLPDRRQPVFFDVFDDDDDEYCEDGIPDVNQGWVGEHYG